MFWRTMGAASVAVLLMAAQAAVADSGTFEVLRGLQVAGKARAVVEHTEQQRPHPLPSRGHHLQGTVMVVPVPQPADVFGFVAAHLAVQ